MKKLLFLTSIALGILVGYSFGFPFYEVDPRQELPTRINLEEEKKEILRVGLVADSHNENDLLGKALRQASGMGINFVIGLGDYTNLGTVGELEAAKREFDKSGLQYFVTAGDRDGWESRNRGDAATNFEKVFGDATQVLEKQGVQFVILDNSDIYRGIAPEDWRLLEEVTKVSKVSKVSKGETNSTSDTFVTSDTFDTSEQPRLRFVFAHKTPFHPQSKHVMGEDSQEVSRQARKLIELMEEEKVDGFFSGDLHFFAKFNSSGGSVKITTIGAVASERNFQGPRFAILTVFSDYSWEVEEVEIR